MKQKLIETGFKYDGSQLKSLFAYLHHGVQGDSIIAWSGACDVSREHMIDGEDLAAESAIRGDQMLHFIVEIFGISLSNCVAVQRLLTAMAIDILRQQAGNHELAQTLRRKGDDIFSAGRKLSISIATVSPVSALVHFAVNISNDGTPVPTLSLSDLRVQPTPFAKALMAAFSEEMESIRAATCKVRPATTC